MEFVGKRVLVIGMARSGVAVSALLCRHHARVTINDRKTEAELGDALAELRGMDMEWRLGEDPVALLDSTDVLVISPACP